MLSVLAKHWRPMLDAYFSRSSQLSRCEPGLAGLIRRTKERWLRFPKKRRRSSNQWTKAKFGITTLDTFLWHDPPNSHFWIYVLFTIRMPQMFIFFHSWRVLRLWPLMTRLDANHHTDRVILIRCTSIPDWSSCCARGLMSPTSSAFSADWNK